MSHAISTTLRLRTWVVLVLPLALGAASTTDAIGQSAPPASRPASVGRLGLASPNPFNADTRIQFFVCDDDRAGSGEQHRVSVRILNILAQPVVAPVLVAAPDSSAATVPAALSGRAITNLKLACGLYVAYWNGKATATGHDIAPGPYLVQIFIDGKLQPSTKKIFYAR